MQIGVRNPSLTNITFLKDIRTVNRCYTVAWFAGKLVAGSGTQLLVYNPSDNYNLDEHQIDGNGIPCVRAAGSDQLAILINRQRLEREIRISSIEKLSHLDTAVCRFEQKNNTVSVLSVTSTHMAARDVENEDLIIFDRQGELIKRMKTGPIEGVHLLPTGTVLVSSATTNSLSKYKLDNDSEPLWTCHGLNAPSSIAADRDGYIYAACISENDNERSRGIYLISPQGKDFPEICYPFLAFLISGESVCRDPLKKADRSTC